MIAPQDIALFAAGLLQTGQTGLFCLEVPETYSSQNAAGLLSRLLHQTDKPSKLPMPDTARPAWALPAFKSLKLIQRYFLCLPLIRAHVN